MKRQERIDRLVAVGYNARELNNQSNANLRVTYEQAGPQLKKRADRLQRVVREQQRKEKERRKLMKKLEDQREQIKLVQEDYARQVAWMRRCVKVPFPPIVANYPPAILDFDLAAFIAHCKMVHLRFGDQDAAATLRVVSNAAWAERTREEVRNCLCLIPKGAQ